MDLFAPRPHVKLVGPAMMLCEKTTFPYLTVNAPLESTKVFQKVCLFQDKIILPKHSAEIITKIKKRDEFRQEAGFGPLLYFLLRSFTLIIPIFHKILA